MYFGSFKALQNLFVELQITHFNEDYNSPAIIYSYFIRDLVVFMNSEMANGHILKHFLCGFLKLSY